MSWPLSQDYNEAIQNPATNFADPDLKRGEAVCNALGLPMPYSGNFADVYQVRCPDGSRWAVKCFTRQAEGLRERYQEISAHLKKARLPFTVDFTYLEQGIRVVGKWYPVLKMEWVEGLTLNQFVRQNLDNPAMLEALLHRWGRIARYLRQAKVGHCDLQHGNILLAPGASANSLALKLIDYDGMWVPALAGTKSGEVGHASYQHPLRLREQTYSLDVDRFPLLLIATALRALKVKGKSLWDRFDNGDNLLFREADLLAPMKSHLFLDLTKTGDPLVSHMMDLLVKALRGSLETVPLLEEVMLPALSDSSASHPALRPATPPTTKAAPVAPVEVLSPLSIWDRAMTDAAKAAPVAPVVVSPAMEDAFVFDGSVPTALVPSATRPRRASSTFLGVPIWAWTGAITLFLVSFGFLAVVVLVIRGDSSAGLVQPGGVPTPTKSSESEVIVVLQIDQPGAEVLVDGQMQAVDVPGDDKPVNIRLKPGPHNISVSKDGFKTIAQNLRLAAGQRPSITVRLVPVGGVAGTRAGEERDDNSLKMRFCWCPAGRFTMGSPPDERGRLQDEGQVEVTLTKGFWLGKYAVTQGEWEKLMRTNPSDFRNGGPGAGKVAGLDTSRFPVEEVTWEAAAEACRQWTEQEHQAGRLSADWEYRLPTEAQWEYACRAGTTTATAFGDQLSSRQANFNGNLPYFGAATGPFLERPTTVGSYLGNAWGLCDMQGNVNEWCRDWYQEKLPGGADPEVFIGSTRVVRGGG